AGRGCNVGGVVSITVTTGGRQPVPTPSAPIRRSRGLEPAEDGTDLAAVKNARGVAGEVHRPVDVRILRDYGGARRSDVSYRRRIRVRRVARGTSTRFRAEQGNAANSGGGDQPLHHSGLRVVVVVVGVQVV